ncbi:hypothetical protein HNO88_003983 [Novosphingobium chloroacetimidivorans]|uniref:Uncharacterized protein n=1 Tax=Novosphingobium chloroacetimidivorans TaxID=1428314 RepID=A0A7W7KD43_9SPHN|nr:hypothetical protein [Novosphingobium chloroacetimidivorans]MBB4860639.1 hypothetical protein [Novosphingobium chloroacetimidivorans]
MPRTHNLALATFDETSNIIAKQAEPAERTDVQLTVIDADATHVRQLQHLLAEAYQEVSPEEKLPIRQRIAAIVALTMFLWALVAAAVYAVL